ncbi:MAG: glycosyltransferase family 2 protein [Syntrophales bacterium]|nr:glycosyltransferase family 2 protein [Syntrophales bacterium]
MVSVIIVNYNTKELLAACLKTLPEGVEGLSRQVIVVDNGSTDGSGEMIKTQFPEVILIENKANLGFSRANNLGAQNASGDALLFLNSDTLIKKNAISILYRTLMESEFTGIVGPKILNVQGQPTRSYMRFLTLPMLFAGSDKLSQFINVERYRLHYTQYDFTHRRAVPWLSGACLLVKRPVFVEVGGFDEAYFFYCEDMDLCLQVSKKGYQIIYEPSAEIIHLFGGSSKEKKEDLYRVYRHSIFHYFRKNFSLLHAWAAWLLIPLTGKKI